MKNIYCFLKKLLTNKRDRSKFLVIALAAVLCIMAVTVAVNMTDNPDYLYELLWNFDAGEGDAYVYRKGNTMMVTNRPGLFKTHISSVDADEWKDSITKVVIEDEISPTLIGGWFSNMTKLKRIEGLEKLDMSRLENMSGMFRDCESLRELDGISDWDTSAATDMMSMFSGCESLTTLDLSGWDVSNVESMSGMFACCASLTTLDLSGWDVSSVESMSRMFGDSGLVEIKGMENWNVAKLENVSWLFENCRSLQNVGNLNQWKVSDEFDAVNAFYGCTSLGTCPPYWAE